MLRTSFWLTAMALAAPCALFLGTGRACADPIQPGFDLLATVPDQTFVDLTPLGLGVVPLMGVPFDTDRIGDTDTIVQRTTGIDPFPIGGSGIVQIQLVGLFLVSQNPVVFPDGTMADMYVTVNLNGDLPIPIYAQMPPSRGQMQVRHELTDGGTFQSFFDVFANVIFTQVGGDPFDPGQVIGVFVSPVVHFMATADWSHIPPDNYPVDDRYPAGSFYVPRPFTEAEMLAAHGIRPASVMIP
jgi:hypothetical protein